jgi:hypothetical protein
MGADRLNEITDNIVGSHPELEEMMVEVLEMINEIQQKYADVLRQCNELLREINKYKRNELLMKKAILNSSKN